MSFGDLRNLSQVIRIITELDGMLYVMLCYVMLLHPRPRVMVWIEFESEHIFALMPCVALI